MPDKPQSYSLAEIAERWRCCHSHVLNLVRRGELTAINIGCGKRARYVVSSDSLEEFETRRTVKPPAPVTKRLAMVRRDGVIEFFK